MVPQHSSPLVGGTRVDWPCARSSAKCAIALRKPLKFRVASLLALGFVIFLLSEPVINAKQMSTVLTALWILLLGLTPIGWIVSLFLDSSAET